MSCLQLGNYFSYDLRGAAGEYPAEKQVIAGSILKAEQIFAFFTFRYFEVF